MEKIIKILLVSGLALMTTVACSKKSDDPGPAPIQGCVMGQQPTIGHNCVNGQLVPAQTCVLGQPVPQGYSCINGYLTAWNNMGVGAGNLLNNVYFTNSYMEGAMSISGNGNLDWNDPRAVVNYYGQVTINGSLQVVSPTLCGAPLGSYSISGTGYMYSGQINNMLLTISGPSMMQLNVGYAVLTNPSGLHRDSTTNRFGILMSSLIVNGQPCGGITTY